MTALEILYVIFKILGFLGACYILANEATRNILGKNSLFEEMLSKCSETEGDER